MADPWARPTSPGPPDPGVPSWPETESRTNRAPSADDYVLIDVTVAVDEWLNGSEPNDGIAIVGNSGLSATFDSKENTGQSHPAELDIVFSSGLPTSCSANQIPQWNGTAWVCAAED